MVPYGGFWWRFLAFILDWIILQVATSFIGGLFGFGLAVPLTGLGADQVTMLWTVMLGMVGSMLASYWLYFALMESSRLQATVGKLAVGVVVTDLDGQRLTFLRASGRFFAKLLSYATFFIGFIMIAFTGRKQGLHDFIAGTLVYKTRDPAMLFDNHDVFA
ncbi:RDD family protein [Novosphingobium resinovorum]|uniref:RDD family protein n=1 Tax=Novosphingobium resinovorum TaxID=158500 RepID=UPI002ED3AC5D|nr:RDD family protein [Novosphingobium resinovorum]